MIHDEELKFARMMVMELFGPGVELTPLQVIEKLKSAELSDGLLRSANLSLVNSGCLEITPDFRLRRPTRELASVA